MVYFNTDTVMRAVRAQEEYDKGTTVGGRRAALYAPIQRSGIMTWHPTTEVTSLVGGYRVSSGNLGCPWPVDKTHKLKESKSALNERLSRYESQVDRLERVLRDRAASRQRPATTGSRLLAGLDGPAGAPGEAEGQAKSVRFQYPRRNPPAVRPTMPFNPNSSFGKQPLSVLKTVPGPHFGSADARNDPFPYWPLTLNPKGSGEHHERVVRAGKDMPCSRWRTAPTPKFSTSASHNDLRFMGRTPRRQGQLI